MHCRLAKFRGLMYQGKYGAVTGFKKPIAWKLLLGTNKNFGIFSSKTITLSVTFDRAQRRLCRIRISVSFQLWGSADKDLSVLSGSRYIGIMDFNYT
jgi:hypothetical protein